jgi:phosphopantothenoylcysteine synthetase/decarboxylase
MGYAIAERLASLGAKVILISGPVSLQCKSENITRINVVSAVEMHTECHRYFAECNGAVMVAAVADFAPLIIENQKIKRTSENYFLELRPNPDIAASLGRVKRKDQILVGFALETSNEQENAALKLLKKNLDLIILNSLIDNGAGFQYDTNKIKILDRSGVIFTSELKQKKEIAVDIVNKILETEDFISELS